MKITTNIKTLVIIILLVAFSLTATYAFVNLTAENNSAVGTAGCFSVNYTGQEINNLSLTSTTDYTTSTSSEVTLSKNENCEIYTEAFIKIHTNDNITAPITGENQALKYKIEKISGNGEILDGGEGVINQIGDMTLATVKLTDTDTTYKVYIWIDSSVSNGAYNGTTYSGYIFAESAQTSTIVPEDGTDDTSGPNSPNLDNNNLIPVYYDNTAEVWKKADSTNANNSWYNYDNKMWANAVIISDNTKRATYQSAIVGTTITESDISAFLVWIPRFKYRVWNITRQGGAENTYAYSAFTNGIDIEWERGTTSTGNVTCSYNVSNNSPETTLSDQCSVNGTNITPESGNKNFTNAWYTHPAFKFNNSNKTGFWIGKFETTGTASSPTVLPDTTALVSQMVSEQFTTSRVFQTYGLSNNVNAHMLTNLEWGAVAYLTHSIYGLCDGTTCRDAYINNSQSMYTGRSAGVNNLVNTYGDYNYKGYSIDSSSGLPTGTKDETLVASSTGNITGVYDVVGGVYEYVMGNVVDDNGEFYSNNAGDSWNGVTTPSTFYYNAYSYGDTYEDQTAFNRAILGDATAEVTGSTDGWDNAWQPGSGITGSTSSFVGSDRSWFIRSGIIFIPSFGSFLFDNNDGGDSSSYSFRLSVS